MKQWLWPIWDPTSGCHSLGVGWVEVGRKLRPPTVQLQLCGCALLIDQKPFESYPAFSNILNLKLHFLWIHLLHNFEKEHHIFSRYPICFHLQEKLGEHVLQGLPSNTSLWFLSTGWKSHVHALAASFPLPPIDGRGLRDHGRYRDIDRSGVLGTVASLQHPESWNITCNCVCVHVHTQTHIQAWLSQVTVGNREDSLWSHLQSAGEEWWPGELPRCHHRHFCWQDLIPLFFLEEEF